MSGLDIFMHAVRMVLNNLSVAIRISAVLMLVQLGTLLLFNTGFLLTGADTTRMIQQGTYPFFGAFVSFLVMIVTGLWIAVAWHRFVLREETPTGPIPPFNGAAIGSYFVAGIIFAVILIVLAIPLGILGGLLVAPLFMSGGQPGLLATLILGLIVYLPLAYVGYRISPILPSAALGARMPVKEAWYKTGTSGAAFVLLTIVSVIAGLLISLPGGYLPSILGTLWAFVAQWLVVMVGASILTTIYGHYVEGRQLNV